MDDSAGSGDLVSLNVLFCCRIPLSVYLLLQFSFWFLLSCSRLLDGWGRKEPWTLESQCFAAVFLLMAPNGHRSALKDLLVSLSVCCLTYQVACSRKISQDDFVCVCYLCELD